MNIGELVNVVVNIGKEHSEQSCPWHEEKKSQHQKLLPANKEEDVPPPGLPKNNGGVLGKNIGFEPEDLTVTVPFSETKPRIAKVKDKDKEIAEYIQDEAAAPYDVVFSAHHIIPGNEALKGHPVLRWVGDTNGLGEYADPLCQDRCRLGGAV